ncbi:unnamed protein product [Notodromas monacha]|uniref:C2H2-type domain-containing protein n=1 Tax=Notodromas monacha TaxID=399045 RepID=A0A7R9GDB0_9CRUS|nr:unnamed protein product [Notodromas monacha]CAG0916982.1 unnamed protein product [Notodromas monacha]
MGSPKRHEDSASRMSLKTSFHRHTRSLKKTVIFHRIASGGKHVFLFYPGVLMVETISLKLMRIIGISIYTCSGAQGPNGFPCLPFHGLSVSRQFPGVNRALSSTFAVLYFYLLNFRNKYGVFDFVDERRIRKSERSMRPAEGLLLAYTVTVHIEPQQGKLQAKRKTAYVCRWIGCKVFGRPSYADGWVSRHVLSAHGRAKPFMCVFPGCYQSFGSEINLRRHVNLHCDNGSGSTNDERVGGSVSTSSNAVGRKSAESTPVKNGKKNNRKGIRYRKRPWSAEKCDFWDPLMSEALSNQLTRTERLIFSSVRSPAAQENGELVQSPSLHPAVGASLMHPFFSQKSCSSITFTGEVIGSRLQSGCKMSLVRWMPHDLLPDEWMTEAEVAEKELLVKTVPVGALSTPAFEISQRLLLGPAVQKRLRPSRRK